MKGIAVFILIMILGVSLVGCDGSGEGFAGIGGGGGSGDSGTNYSSPSSGGTTYSSPSSGGATSEGGPHSPEPSSLALLGLGLFGLLGAARLRKKRKR